MKVIQFPEGFHLERLVKAHPRSKFISGQPQVDEWIRTKALQHLEKRLSTTQVLLDEKGIIAGYYTLAMGQIDFADLPQEHARKLPRRMLPVAVLAWLGMDTSYQGQGLGRLLLAQALRDCYVASQSFAFVAIILDCVNDAAKAFYQHFDFTELPGYPYRLFLTASQLEAMMTGK
jgi:GNAT superfamily N-acetyltransferase